MNYSSKNQNMTETIIPNLISDENNIRSLPCNRILVLDTSMFSDPQSRKWLGKNTAASVSTFLKLASYAKDLRFFMPRSIRDELVNLAGTEIPLLDTQVTIKSPSIYELSIPSALFYEFLEDLRARFDKGLRITEEIVRSNDKHLNEDELIRKLREKYRSALRDGIVDSKEDFEVILLAKEIHGSIVTADKGLQKYADKIGVGIIDAHVFPEFLLFEVQKYNPKIIGFLDDETIW